MRSQIKKFNDLFFQININSQIYEKIENKIIFKWRKLAALNKIFKNNYFFFGKFLVEKNLVLPNGSHSQRKPILFVFSSFPNNELN